MEFQKEEVTEEYCCVSVNPQTVVKKLDHACEGWSQRTVNCEESKHVGVVYQKDRSYRGLYGTPMFNTGVLLKCETSTGSTRKTSAIEVFYSDANQL